MKILSKKLLGTVATLALLICSLLAIIATSFSSTSLTVKAKRDKKAASTTKTSATPTDDDSAAEAAEPLVGSPATRLTSIDEFRNKIMETTMPALLFLGSHKPSTKQALRDNVTAAAIALERHVVSFYINTVTPMGKEFLASIGIQKTDETPRILLWNPDYVKQEGGYGKQSSQYTGGTSPYAITRWFMAMLSRKHVDTIEDVEDLVAFKHKYRQFSLPKVILVTGSNFTSPLFTTMSHQFKALAHFGAITSVSRKAYDSAMDVFEKEERELRKIKDLNLGSIGSADEDASSSSEQSQQKQRHLPHNFAIHDESEKATQNSAHQSEEKKDAAHSELLHVLGCQSVPAIITASADLADVEVHSAGSNLNMDKLIEIVGGHALSQDQFKTLFGQVLEYDFAVEKGEQQLARDQKKNAKKNGGGSDSGKASSGNDKNNNDKKSNNDDFLPIVVKSPEVWKNNCPHKKSGTLCVAVFSEDLQENILKYEGKVAELAKGIKKIQDKNRNGYESVKLMLFESNEQNMKLARVWSAADGVLPQVVYVNPNKGSYHNHIGSFSGSSMSDFVLGQMKTVRAKTFNKDQVLNDFFGGDDEERLKKQKAQEAAEKKLKKAEEEKRKQREKMSPAQRERLELEESLNAEDL